MTILNAQYNKASDILIDKVQQEIDPTRDGSGVGFAPIGHVVTVDTVKEVEINITANITFQNGYSWLSTQEHVIQAIKDYLLELRQMWAKFSPLAVRIAQIESRILSVQGILDISDTSINGDTNNLTLNEYEVPVYGGIVADA